MTRRRSGILLHLTSIPSRYGVGDLGDGAYRFADFLAEAGQSLWQILPLTPTSSAERELSLHLFFGVCRQPSFDQSRPPGTRGFPDARRPRGSPVFCRRQGGLRGRLPSYKQGLLRKAFARFVRERPADAEFAQFCREQASWLDDYALFAAFKDHAGGSPWSSWPTGMKRGTEAESASMARKTCREQFRQRNSFSISFSGSGRPSRATAISRIFRSLAIFPFM